MTSEILMLERRGWEALCGPAGAAFYDELMADLYVSDDKAGFIYRIEAPSG